MAEQQRYIAHFDLDSFFVSVELLQQPALKGKAVIVGGTPERGVVTSCSYEARKFGVRSAMPMSRAMKLCPHAVVLRGTHAEYRRYSQWVTDIIAAKAPLFEKASIDEFYIDLTGMDRFFDPYQWTIDLRQEIIDKTQLPISFGLAANKMGKTGADLWKKSQGIHNGQVHAYHEAKSISSENTFHENTADTDFLLSELVRLTERVAFELRRDEKLAGCIAVKIRYPDFETTSKQTTISRTLRDDELIPQAIELFHQLYRKGQSVRLLGVRLSELTNHAVQASLFDDAERKNKLYKAIDEVKNKFGKTALKKARTLKKGKG